MTMRLRRIAAALLMATVATVVHATPSARAISLPNGLNTLIVPQATLVQYRSTGSTDDIHFSGRFVLSGEFHYGCDSDCGEPDQDYFLYIVPSAAEQLRLPHWSERSGILRVYIIGNERVLRDVIPRREMDLLRAGKVKEVAGRISIVVENYVATIECDAPSYFATFVALERPAEIAALPAGDRGC
jgi:hypothetical protein